MARRGHYSYERRQRDLAKVAKREAKREARAAAKLAKQPGGPATPDDADEPNAESLLDRRSPEDPAASGE